jgi:hypothetical protein
MFDMIGWICFGTTLVILLISLYYNYKFAKILIKMEDSISDSLDKLDERYTSISKVLEIPLFYDSPQIRQVINDVQACRDSILLVANNVAQIEESDGKEEIS